MAQVEIGLAVLRKACDEAVDKLGGAVPGVQLRALLIFDDAGGSLDMRQLAAELTTSSAAASKVCDRMQEAGLMTVEDTSSRGALCGVLTDFEHLHRAGPISLRGALNGHDRHSMQGAHRRTRPQRGPA